MQVRSSVRVDGAWLHLKHDLVCGLVFCTLSFPSRAMPMAMEADVFAFGHPDLTLHLSHLSDLLLSPADCYFAGIHLVWALHRLA